ncbi:MAG TPA: hypothetical protein VM450_12315 [Thermomicrobiales bacterium]|jgi:hypothetical protein|nr:hypothetical protein [Thermomicrobiales bacterium]
MTSRYDRWEYHIEAIGARTDVSRLNALGNEGWELVATLPEGHLVFKRPAPNLRERITLDQRAAVDAAQDAGAAS